MLKKLKVLGSLNITNSVLFNAHWICSWDYNCRIVSLCKRVEADYFCFSLFTNYLSQ